jgi:hypothetical protein
VLCFAAHRPFLLPYFSSHWLLTICSRAPLTHSLIHSLSWCSHDRERLPSPVSGDNMLPPSLTHSLTHSLLLLLLLLLSATASLTHTHDRGVPSVFPRAEMHLQLGFDLSLSAAADQSREQCFRFLPNAPFQGE